MNPIIAVDFDGVLNSAGWPHMKGPDVQMIVWLRLAQAHGIRVILWTCRDGEVGRSASDWLETCLDDQNLQEQVRVMRKDEIMGALKGCKIHGLRPDLVNKNHPQAIQLYDGSDPRKVWADLYLDDHGLGYTRGAALLALHDLVMQQILEKQEKRRW